MTKKFICYDVDQLPHCCGAYEAGNLLVNTVSDNHYREMSLIIDSHIVTAMQQERPLFINFATDEGHETDDTSPFICSELLDALLGHPLVVDLGIWTNPGSGNRIHGVMIKGTNHED